jgi:hypothetical protein
VAREAESAAEFLPARRTLPSVTEEIGPRQRTRLERQVLELIG